MTRPQSPAGRIEMIRSLLGGEDIYDDDGVPTGQKTPQIITPKQALILLKTIGSIEPIDESKDLLEILPKGRTNDR